MEQANNPPDFQDVLMFACDSVDQFFMIELIVTSSHESTRIHGSAMFIISGKPGSNNTVTTSTEFIGGDREFVCRTQIKYNQVTVQLRAVEPSLGIFGSVWGGIDGVRAVERTGRIHRHDNGARHKRRRVSQHGLGSGGEPCRDRLRLNLDCTISDSFGMTFRRFRIQRQQWLVFRGAPCSAKCAIS